jgi:hypothetical protein
VLAFSISFLIAALGSVNTPVCGSQSEQVVAINRSRWSQSSGARSHDAEAIQAAVRGMPHRKFATTKALIDYAEQQGLVYVWENGHVRACLRPRLLSGSLEQRPP